METSQALIYLYFTNLNPKTVSDVSVVNSSCNPFSLKDFLTVIISHIENYTNNLVVDQFFLSDLGCGRRNREAREVEGRILHSPSQGEEFAICPSNVLCQSREVEYKKVMPVDASWKYL